MSNQNYFLIISMLVLSGCSIFRKTPKTALTDGYYTQRGAGERKKIYVEIVEDTINVYPARTENEKLVIDTILSNQMYPPEKNDNKEMNTSILQHTFDIDFLAIPFKFRPSNRHVPAQLNTHLNCAIYFGYRTDMYKIDFKKNALGRAKRKTMHFGFSLGILSGFGNTFMSPTNTSNNLQQEYDGIVWSNGIASIVAVNNFSVGFAFGIDKLLDKNRTIWIYESKPWFGLAFGLNLN